MSNKYYATITLKVIINADDKDEANEILESLIVPTAETIDENCDASTLEATYKITDVK